MIESRNGLLKTLQLSLSEFQTSTDNLKNTTNETPSTKINVFKKELEQHKWFTKDLQSIAAKRKTA